MGPRAEHADVRRERFVGRGVELSRLAETLGSVLEGNGALVTVSGEPGIGKTALCEEFARQLTAHGVEVLRGACFEERSLARPFLPFAAALRPFALSLPPETLTAFLGPGAAFVARLLPELREAAGIEPASAGDPGEDRWRLFQAVADFLENAARRQPLALILEDLHWADQGTLDLLAHIVREVRTAPVLLVGTYRDLEVDRAHPLSKTLAELRRSGPFTTIRLGGFELSDVEEALVAVAGAELPRSFAEEVLRQTEGNPLFVHEVARDLLDRGLLAPGGDGELAATLALLAVPAGLRDVIGARLSRLEAETNDVLAVAAVIGREFPVAVVGTVANLRGEAVPGAIEESLRAGLIEEVAGGEVTYRFAHDLFRQALYEELRGPRRVRLHVAAGRALEAHYARHLDEHAAEIAGHFSQSSDPGDLASAVSYFERAAIHSRLGFDPAGAAAGFEKAIATQERLDPEDRERLCDLRLALCEPLHALDEPGRVFENAERAYDLAIALEDRPRAADAAAAVLRITWAVLGIGGLQAEIGRKWTERAAANAPDGTAAKAWALMSEGLGAPGWTNDRRDTFEHAFEVAMESGDAISKHLTGYALLTWAPRLRKPTPAEILDMVERVETSPGGGAWSLVWLLSGAGQALFTIGDREDGERLYRRIIATAEGVHDARVIARAATAQIELDCLDGRLEEALAAGARITSAVGRPQMVVSTMRPALYLGRVDEVLRGMAEANYRWTANIRASIGRLDRAREALALPRETPGGWAEICALEGAVLLGERAAVADSVRWLESRDLPETTGNWFMTIPQRHLGDAYAFLGETERALAAYRAALETATKMRFRPELALVRLGLAELAVRGGPSERAEGIKHATFALAELEAMKMAPFLERARAAVTALESHPVPKPAHPDGLSDREVEVLRLLAAGRSNQQIADELFISLNTVARHVSNIFDKTGAANRTEAGMYAVRNGLAR